MRFGLTLSFFSLSFLLFSQDLAFKIQDSLPQITSLKTSLKDSLQLSEIDTKLKTDSLKLEGEGPKKISKLKKEKKKGYRPYIKSMEEVIISDYKILYLDETEKSVDTSLSLEGEYTLNFLRKDYFE